MNRNNLTPRVRLFFNGGMIDVAHREAEEYHQAQQLMAVRWNSSSWSYEYRPYVGKDTWKDSTSILPPTTLSPREKEQNRKKQLAEERKRNLRAEVQKNKERRKIAFSDAVYRTRVSVKQPIRRINQYERVILETAKGDFILWSKKTLIYQNPLGVRIILDSGSRLTARMLSANRRNIAGCIKMHPNCFKMSTNCTFFIDESRA